MGRRHRAPFTFRRKSAHAPVRQYEVVLREPKRLSHALAAQTDHAALMAPPDDAEHRVRLPVMCDDEVPGAQVLDRDACEVGR